MPSPIIARADALMQRRRTSESEHDDIPVLTDSVDENDDFPVLLNIDEAPDASEGKSDPDFRNVDPPAPPLTLDAGVRDILAHELARKVEQRLLAELPQIIELAVRDFLAEHEMIARLQARD